MLTSAKVVLIVVRDCHFHILRDGSLANDQLDNERAGYNAGCLGKELIFELFDFDFSYPGLNKVITVIHHHWNMDL